MTRVNKLVKNRLHYLNFALIVISLHLLLVVDEIIFDRKLFLERSGPR